MATTTSTKKSAATKKSATKKSAAKKAATKATGTAKKAATKATGRAKKATTKAAGTAKSTARKSATTASKSATKTVKKASKQSARNASSTSSRPTDAIALLKQDHREIKDLFEKFEATGPRAHKTRESTVANIIEKLSVHAGIEEAVLYPAVRERVPAADGDVLEALEEHHVAKQTLAELQRMNSQHERFAAKVTVLMESVRHHIDEEEKDLFPEVRDGFTRGELEEMAERLAEARIIAPKRPHPHAPDVPPANIAANIVAVPLDAATSVAESVANKVRDIVT